MAKAKKTSVKVADIASVNQAIQMFKTEEDRYPKDLNELISKGYRIDTLVSHPDYNVATIKLKFLRSETRASTLDTIMLARVY